MPLNKTNLDLDLNIIKKYIKPKNIIRGRLTQQMQTNYSKNKTLGKKMRLMEKK
uniref:Uncharacterized protein n=1 Tax=viral metagenome TaxID=1070528 RepID=A0A6C0HL67_9ZZZZ